MLNRPKHITSLRTSCILAIPDVSIWAATKQDKQAGSEITAAKHADADAASVTQHLLAGMQSHKNLKNFRQTVANWADAEMFPWMGGAKLVPVVRLPRIKKREAELQTEFEDLKQKFGAEYLSERSNRAFKMGQFFDPANYPPLDVVLSKFQFHITYMEVPEGDFREVLFQEGAEDLQNFYAQETERYIREEVLSKQAEQFTKVMESISATCQINTEVAADGEVKIKRRKLHESTIKKAIEYCDTFKHFNLAEDQKLEDARSSLEKVLRDTDIGVLKESDSMRAHVKSEVDEILKRFKA